MKKMEQQSRFTPSLSLIGIIILFIMPISAYANTAKPTGGLKPNALSLAVTLALEGVGWIMDEGTKVNKTTPTDGTSDGTGTTTGTGTRPVNQYGDYPQEFIFNSLSFGSASSAHEYIVNAYIKEKGMIRTRRPSDGLEYDSLNISYGSTWGYRGIGIFRSCVQVSQASDPPKNLIGGSLQCFTGEIFYKGLQSDSNVTTSQDYKDKRQQAQTALEQAIAEAAKHNESAVNEAIESLTNMKADTKYDSAAIDAIIAQLTGVNAVPASTTGTTTGTQQVGATTGTTTGTQTDAQTNTNTDSNTSNPAKPTDTPFEMPSFCGWAKPVCDFIDWFQKEPPEPSDDNKVTSPELHDLGINDTRFTQSVNFEGQCPTGNFQFRVGHKLYQKSIPYHHFCGVLIMLKPWLLAFTYLSTAMFILSNL